MNDTHHHDTPNAVNPAPTTPGNGGFPTKSDLNRPTAETIKGQTMVNMEDALERTVAIHREIKRREREVEMCREEIEIAMKDGRPADALKRLQEGTQREVARLYELLGK
jgi:hypothetical protein